MFVFRYFFSGRNCFYILGSDFLFFFLLIVALVWPWCCIACWAVGHWYGIGSSAIWFQTGTVAVIYAPTFLADQYEPGCTNFSSRCFFFISQICHPLNSCRYSCYLTMDASVYNAHTHTHLKYPNNIFFFLCQLSVKSLPTHSWAHKPQHECA